MDAINLTDAKANLSELVDRVQAGDTIAITRRGKAVACLVAANKPRKPIDRVMLQVFTATLSLQPLDAGELVRAMRDGDRT